MGEHGSLSKPGREEHFADPRLGTDLLWRDVRVPRFASPTPALFLDRDGVIIEEKNYISDPNEVQLLPEIPELIHAARSAGMAVIEITNQAGIGRGYHGWKQFIAVEDRITAVLADRGAHLDAVLACPYHGQALPPYDRPSHAWRKPNPGMLIEARHLLNLDLRLSLLVGDKAADQEAARAAGLAHGVHVLTGYGRAQESAARAAASVNFAVHVVEHAAQAATLLPLSRAVLSGEEKS
jgi:D-glycero-D-manno-heptose 1,7-bisphosphate phosphatase